MPLPGGGSTITSANQISDGIITGAKLVDGTITDSKTNFTAAINTALAEANIDIIELQANSLIDPLDHDTSIADTFSDSDGYNGSVAVGGNTTATFLQYGDHAIAGGSITAGEDSQQNVQSNQSLFQIFTPTESVILRQIQVKGLIGAGTPANPLKVELWSVSAGTPSAKLVSFDDITAGSFGVSAAWLSSYGSYPLDSGTKYALVFYTSDAGGNNPALREDAAGSSYADGSGYGNGTPGTFSTQANIRILFQLFSSLFGKYYPASTTKKIRITLPTITGTVTATELVLNCPDREGDDAVNYLLHDSASGQDSSLAINTKNTLVNVNGASLSAGYIEINLTRPSSPSNAYAPSVKSYCLKLWK